MCGFTLSEARPSMKGMRNPPPGLEQSCELSPSVSLQGMTGHTLIPGERKGETRAGWVCSEINRVWYQVPFSLSVLSDNQEYVRTHTPTVHIRSLKFQRKQHFYHNNNKKNSDHRGPSWVGSGHHKNDAGDDDSQAVVCALGAAILTASSRGGLPPTRTPLSPPPRGPPPQAPGSLRQKALDGIFC